LKATPAKKLLLCVTSLSRNKNSRIPLSLKWLKDRHKQQALQCSECGYAHAAQLSGNTRF
ncbi:hypothetical protein, partial [Klebsiella sp. ME-303]|uniref:hypothetical protein n=1 Tax=Klebsiella sp. ME-303 TaxID=2600607 RepID=UPI001C94E37E